MLRRGFLCDTAHCVHGEGCCWPGLAGAGGVNDSAGWALGPCNNVITMALHWHSNHAALCALRTSHHVGMLYLIFSRSTHAAARGV